MQTRYPEAGAYSCAAELWRAIMAAAAYCEPAPAHLTPAAALHWTPDAIDPPEWREAGPGEVPEFFELATVRTWEGGQYVARLAHTPETARPVLAFHGPGRPHLAAPRVTFAYQPGPGARASFTVAGTHARLQSMAEQVRKHWALYGGGPLPAELAKPKPARKPAAWPAATLKAWRLLLQDGDHTGAMMAADKLGAKYYPASGENGAFCLAAPLQVEGLPAGLCSALRQDGRFVVSCMVSGLALGRHGAGSRARAEADALAEWARITPEKAGPLVAAAQRDRVADTVAGRAAWCKAHGIEDPAGPGGHADRGPARPGR